MKKLISIICIASISLMAFACSGGDDSIYMGDGESLQYLNPYPYPGADTDIPSGMKAPSLPDSEDREAYLSIIDNPAVSTLEEPTLTFSLKVDTAAYTNVVRYIDSGNLPPLDAVRTEELINYFTYENPMHFTDDSPFALDVEVGPSPFNPESYLAFIRVKTKDIDKSELPPSNLTFLIDTSGSMNSFNRLPLLVESFGLLVETLSEDDRVSIVTYAGSSEVLLDGVSGADKDTILSALDKLTAGGSTAGAQGIQTAYALAEKNFIAGANNRVILATDGDFNVGASSNNALAELVGERRGNGVYLSILGYGMGNIRDDLMETLSKEGNGNYFYINDLSAAKKALVDELASNLYTIADDVKAQVEFNPDNVKSYRLIGYENRRLSNEDFVNDEKDAGEIGIGTDVIMMFELELSQVQPDLSGELFDVRIRYKDPGESESKLITYQVFFENIVETGSNDFRFASSVAAFAHLLRGSEYSGSITINDVYALAEGGLGLDAAGYRMDFMKLLDKYRQINSNKQ